MRKKEFVLILIVVSALLLNGCCVVCPPVQTGPQFAVTGIGKCELLEDFRVAIPYADSRYVKDKLYSLMTLENTGKVFSEFDIRQTDVFSSFYSIPGYENIPFGYVEYPNGMKTLITAVWNNNEVQFYKVYVDKMVRMDGDYNVTKGVIY